MAFQSNNETSSSDNQDNFKDAKFAATLLDENFKKFISRSRFFGHVPSLLNFSKNYYNFGNIQVNERVKQNNITSNAIVVPVPNQRLNKVSPP